MRINKCDRCNKEIKEDKIFKVEFTRERCLYIYSKKFELCESCASEFYKTFLKEQEK